MCEKKKVIEKEHGRLSIYVREKEASPWDQTSVIIAAPINSAAPRTLFPTSIPIAPDVLLFDVDALGDAAAEPVGESGDVEFWFDVEFVDEGRSAM